ncbi:MAG: FtsW/RodA/SpoVE family cell cycle protein [Planctomycetota bacterium]
MAGLIAIGIIAIYASGNPQDPSGETTPGSFSASWKKQLVFAVIGLLALVTVNTIDYRWLGPASYWIYGIVLVGLAVLLLGKVVNLRPFVPVINGTCRWFRLGTSQKFIQVQPSEFCKIAYILALAWYLRFRSNYRNFSGLIGPFALTLLAMVLILNEPDLGTVLLMMPILFSMLFVAGAKVKHLLLIVLMAVLVSPLLWYKMNLYQRQRISCVLLQSETVRDKLKQSPRLAKLLTGRENFSETQWEHEQGWQLQNSKSAIASGGLRGYGFGKGPYLRYDYLPERHNDFIFAIIAHQWGFGGCIILILLYGVIIACSVEIALLNTDAFARLISVGIISMFAVQILVNVSMTLGLMPITGLTLPLVSYGGSSLVVSMIAIGLLNNIGRYRPFSIAAKAFET